jgi:hypothetical protein
MNFHLRENDAIEEIIAGFEQETGKQVEFLRPEAGEIIRKPGRRLRPGARPASCWCNQRTLGPAALRWRGTLAKVASLPPFAMLRAQRQGGEATDGDRQ